MNKRLRVVLPIVSALLLIMGLLTACEQDTWQENDAGAQTYGCGVYREQGCAKMVIASGGELEAQSGGTIDFQSGVTVGLDDVTFNGTNTHTLGAADKVLLDGDTTNQTQTAGVLDIDVGTVTANVSGFNVAMTTDTGTTAATDVFGGVMTLTQNDADADMFGLKITAAATTNAAANSYEYLLFVDCAENTAGACIDGILVTSSGANTGMTDGLDVSADNIVNAVNAGSNLIAGGNSDTVSVGATDNTFIFAVDSTNAAVFTGADASGAADTTYDTTGAGAITIGSVDVTAITLSTDGTGTTEVVLPAGSVATGEIADDTITFANISDSSAVDADTTLTLADGIELVLQPSHTTGDTEGLLIDVNQADDAVNTDDLISFKIEATSESGDAGDTIRGIVVNYENGTANTIMDAAIAIDNAETTAATLTDAVIVTSSGVDAGVTDAIDVSAANILNALNIGDNDVLVGTLFGIKNGATGSVILNFHDYADTADDDMAHAAITVNCTDAGTGAEDCDLTIGVVEAGAAAETRLNLDADGGITIGSANNNTVNLTTDATGDAELVVPENSIGPDELAVMVDQVIFCGQNANNSTIYGGPIVAFLGGDYTASGAIGGTVCDALDNATEATADAPLGFANTAFKILGMICEVDTSGANGLTLTLRDDAADIVPSVTCTIATGQTTCTSVVASTTDVAAGSAMAIKSVTTTDLSLNDFWCKVFVAYK